MDFINLDEIPSLIEEGKLTVNRACMEIYLTLYTNPARFKLESLDEDSRSDFLLYFTEKRIPTILENYDPTILKFGAFIYSVVQLAKKSYLQKQKEISNYRHTCFSESVLDYKESQEKNSDIIEKISQEKIEYSKSTNTEKEIPQLVFKRIFEPRPGKNTPYAAKKNKLSRGVLLGAFKSAWYINDYQIKRISSFCKISPDIVSSTICKIKANLITKAISRENFENSRNRAYSFVCNYKQLLEDDELDSIHFEQIKKKLNYQESNYKRKTSLLQEGRYKIAPTNSELAEILGLPVRYISRYLSELKNISEKDIAEIESSDYLN